MKGIKVGVIVRKRYGKNGEKEDSSTSAHKKKQLQPADHDAHKQFISNLLSAKRA